MRSRINMFNLVLLAFFFAVFDSLVAITTRPAGAQNYRSGRFRADDDRRLPHPLLRMRARGNKIITEVQN